MSGKLSQGPPSERIVGISEYMHSMYCTDEATVHRVRLVELLEAQAEVDNHRDQESTAQRRRSVHVVIVDRTAFPAAEGRVLWSQQGRLDAPAKEQMISTPDRLDAPPVHARGVQQGEESHSGKGRSGSECNVVWSSEGVPASVYGSRERRKRRLTMRVRVGDDADPDCRHHDRELDPCQSCACRGCQL